MLSKAVHAQDFSTHLVHRSRTTSTAAVLAALPFPRSAQQFLGQLSGLYDSDLSCFSRSESFRIFLHFVKSSTQKVFALGDFAQTDVAPQTYM